MTRKQMEEERERLLESYTYNDEMKYVRNYKDLHYQERTYRAAFNAAMELSERERVKPLRDALKVIAEDVGTYPGQSEVEIEQRKAAERILAQVKEWE